MTRQSEDNLKSERRYRLNYLTAEVDPLHGMLFVGLFVITALGFRCSQITSSKEPNFFYSHAKAKDYCNQHHQGVEQKVEEAYEKGEANLTGIVQCKDGTKLTFERYHPRERDDQDDDAPLIRYRPFLQYGF